MHRDYPLHKDSPLPPALADTIDRPCQGWPRPSSPAAPIQLSVAARTRRAANPLAKREGQTRPVGGKSDAVYVTQIQSRRGGARRRLACRFQVLSPMAVRSI